MRWVSRAISMQGAAAADGKRPQVQVLSLGPILIKVDSKRINLNFFVLFHLLLVFLFVHCAVKIGLCTKIVSGI